MKFILERYKKTIQTKGNIFAIYGGNNSGKTLLMNHLEIQLANNKLPLFEMGYENYNDIIFLNEGFSLKSELELSKKSMLRTNLFSKVRNLIEEKEFDLLYKLKTSYEMNHILALIDREVSFEQGRFNIEALIPFTTDLELVEHLIKLRLSKDGLDFKESYLSRTEKFQIFHHLFLTLKTKNKIILFDSPDTGLDFLTLKKLTDFIKELSKENLVFLTYRNPETFALLELYDEEFLYLEDQKINTLELNENLFLTNYIEENNLITKENINSIENYKKLFFSLKKVSEEEDWKKMKRNFWNNLLVPNLKYINLRTKELDEVILDYFSYGYLAFTFFLKSNNFNKGNFFDNKLSLLEKEIINLF